MSSPTSAPRIFISYARRDGKELARNLRRRLSEEHGFSLWQDLPDMEGGKDWWKQITEAIARVEYLVLIMTEAAVRSPVVHDEWRHARQHGVCVIPVLAAPDLDFSQLAGWMRRTHFVDPNVAEQWTRFVRTLENPCTAARVPMMAEALPEHFIARPEEFELLRSQLLDTSRREAVAVTAALRGAGGYGKTTLARALCQDDAIQEAFYDGILWVTLGEQPGDLGTKLEESPRHAIRRALGVLLARGPQEQAHRAAGRPQPAARNRRRVELCAPRAVPRRRHALCAADHDAQ